MLVKAGRMWGEKAPHSNALKPLIEQPIAIYLLMVAGREGAQPDKWLIPYFQDLTAISLF